jgi:hypothetical protein
MSQIPPRGPLDPWITVVFGLMFWLTVMLVVPTLIALVTSWR